MFSNIERLKIVNQILSDAINLNVLHEYGYINNIFPLNDKYELEGKTQFSMFTHIFNHSYELNLVAA